MKSKADQTIGIRDEEKGKIHYTSFPTNCNGETNPNNRIEWSEDIQS
jgi:hypothetical protein